jgi:hypothetical protein
VVKNKGKGKIERANDGMVFHYPHYGRNSAARPQSAIYVGDYKLLHLYETGVTSLFKITDDIGEQKDLSQEMPKRASKMKEMLLKYLKDVDAPMVAENPNYGKEPTAQGEQAGERGQANASGQGRDPALRQERQEEVAKLEKAYEQNDRETMGEVIASMKERLEAAAGRGTSGQGAAGQSRGPGNSEERQKELQELEKALQQNDRSKMEELIANIKQRMENGPARQGRRGAGGRGGRAGGQGPGAGGPRGGGGKNPGRRPGPGAGTGN